MEDNLKKLRKEFCKVNSEKNEFEQVIFKQENKVNELGEKVKIIDGMLKEKNNQISAYESQCMGLINIIEDQKKQIKMNKVIKIRFNFSRILSIRRISLKLLPTILQSELQVNIR